MGNEKSSKDIKKAKKAAKEMAAEGKELNKQRKAAKKQAKKELKKSKESTSQSIPIKGYSGTITIKIRDMPSKKIKGKDIQSLADAASSKFGGKALGVYIPDDF